MDLLCFRGLALLNFIRFRNDPGPRSGHMARSVDSTRIAKLKELLAGVAQNS